MKLHSVVERLGFFVISAVYRRRGVLLLAPLLYISGMLLYMGTSGFDSVVNISSRHGSGYGDDITKPGSVYRSPQVFEKLWPFMEAENNGSSNLVYTYIYIFVSYSFCKLILWGELFLAMNCFCMFLNYLGYASVNLLS